ncbi:MAG: hypothetical protein LZ171_03165 [Thaumarchaeota archaeon]|nr:hypothetical protein [Candidatus Geocrenenecus arthurdayi]
MEELTAGLMIVQLYLREDTGKLVSILHSDNISRYVSSQSIIDFIF